MQTYNSLEKRRRRAGGAEGKEESVETEDTAGNTPIPPNAGVGVSTRRTTYVMVSNEEQAVSLGSSPSFY